MPLLTITLDVDVDPARDDPHDVATDLLAHEDGGWGHGRGLRQYAGRSTSFVGAEWEDRG